MITNYRILIVKEIVSGSPIIILDGNKCDCVIELVIS